MSLPRAAGWLLTFLVVAACGWALHLHFEIGFNSDNQVLLQQTQRWLEGRPLYTSLVMPSPPMIFLLYAPIVAAAAAGGLAWGLAFDLWTSALVAASLLACHHICVSRPGARDRLADALTLALLAAGLVVLPLRDNVFGDRDHLFAVLFTPYLLLLSPFAAAAALDRPARVLIGLCAAIGLGIKPFYLAIWGLQLGYWVLRERSVFGILRRDETRAVAAALAVYVLATVAFFPEYARVVAPMAWATYSSISPPATHRLATLELIWSTILALPLAGCAGLLARATRPQLRDPAYGLALCVGASVSSFAGGWHYAWYPLYLLAFAFSASVIVALLGAARDLWPRSRLRAGVCLLAGLFLCGMPVATQLFEPARERGAIDREHQRRTGWPRGRQRAPLEIERFLDRHLDRFEPARFLLLGGGIWDSRLANFEPLRISVSRFYTLWPLPALVATAKTPERAARMEWIRLALLEGVTQDLREGRPDVVFVERSRVMWGLPHAFDVLGFLASHPPFAVAWQDYTLVERIDACDEWPSFCAFDVYYRKDATPLP